MFSGKTNILVNKYQQAKNGNLHKFNNIRKVRAYKPLVDERYDDNQIVTHDGASIECDAVLASKEFSSELKKAKKNDLVFIDEAHFINSQIYDILSLIVNSGVGVFVSALDKDYCNKPFRMSGKLSAGADFLQKMSAICDRCGAPATRSQRLDEDGNIVPTSKNRMKVGGEEIYEARCVQCWKHPPNK